VMVMVIVVVAVVVVKFSGGYICSSRSSSTIVSWRLQWNM